MMLNDANYVDRRCQEDLRCEGPTRSSNFPTVQALAPSGRVFLHDPRLVCHLSHSISRLKNREDSAVDSFFWPLAANDSSQGKKNDHNFRPYSVPAPRNDQYRLHDQALYSLWMHYVEFCRITAKAKKTPRAPKMAPQDLPVNIFTQRSRLPVFQLLSSSNGCPISPDQFRFATFERIRAMNGGVVEQPPVVTAHIHMHTPAMKASVVPLKPIHSSPTGVTARLSFCGGDVGVSATAQAARYSHELQQQQQQQAHAEVLALALREAAAATCYASRTSPAVPPASVITAKAAVSAVPGSGSLGTSSGFTSFSSVSSSGSAGQVGVSNNLFDDIPLVAEEEEVEGDEGEGRVKEGEKEEVAANKQQHQWSARRTMAAAGAMRTQSLKQ